MVNKEEKILEVLQFQLLMRVNKRKVELKEGTKCEEAHVQL